jgi:hypothetical protein
MKDKGHKPRWYHVSLVELSQIIAIIATIALNPAAAGALGLAIAFVAVGLLIFFLRDSLSDKYGQDRTLGEWLDLLASSVQWTVYLFAAGLIVSGILVFAIAGDLATCVFFIVLGTWLAIVAFRNLGPRFGQMHASRVRDQHMPNTT